MVKVRDGKASYDVGPATLDEALYLLAEAQARAFEDDSPELIFLQDNPGIKIEVAGNIKFADSETEVVLNEGPREVRPIDESESFKVVGKSPSNPYDLLVEDEHGQQMWFDLKEPDNSQYAFRGVETIADIPYVTEDMYQDVYVVDDGIEVDDSGRSYYPKTVREPVDRLPIDPENIIRVIPFGARGNPAWNRTRGYHIGVDILAPHGTEVRADLEGVVIAISVPQAVDLDDVYGTPYASLQRTGDPSEPKVSVYNPEGILVPGRQDFGDDWVLERGGGATVIVRSGNIYTLYAHLDPKSIQVGRQVMQGQVVGTVGKDEKPNNDHLHYERRTHGWNAMLLDASGEYIIAEDVNTMESRDSMPQVFIDPMELNSDEFNARMRATLQDRWASPKEELLAYDAGPVDGRVYRGNRDNLGQVWRPKTNIVNP